VVKGDYIFSSLLHSSRLDPVSDFHPITLAKSKFSLFNKENINYSLGKLGFKLEPAGKIRVFAMVDIWTQWLLFPLHRFLQNIVRPLDEDATFDQIGKLEKKIKDVRSKGIRKAYSYDLSSATDRLPVVLQTVILIPLLGKRAAVHWSNILCNRKYSIPSYIVKKYKLPLSEVTYSVGQPMGALSSWMMLAVAHHIVIQWASLSAKKWRSRGWYFKDYIVLGDDVVIFNSYVADRYFYIMTNILGVKIGLAKSIVSRSGLHLEFAKKYYVDGESCNLIPLRD